MPLKRPFPMTWEGPLYLDFLSHKTRLKALDTAAKAMGADWSQTALFGHSGTERLPGDSYNLAAVIQSVEKSIDHIPWFKKIIPVLEF